MSCSSQIYSCSIFLPFLNDGFNWTLEIFRNFKCSCIVLIDAFQQPFLRISWGTVAMVNRTELDTFKETFINRLHWDKTSGLFTLTDLKRRDSGICKIDSKEKILTASYNLRVYSEPHFCVSVLFVPLRSEGGYKKIDFYILDKIRVTDSLCHHKSTYKTFLKHLFGLSSKIRCCLDGHIFLTFQLLSTLSSGWLLSERYSQIRTSGINNSLNIRCLNINDASFPSL
uniref:Uncharacterized protein n=1 Tax=Amphiprion ocellaris TaxID=80972 RepID=A0AAQ5XHN7_AMPOC